MDKEKKARLSNGREDTAAYDDAPQTKKRTTLVIKQVVRDYRFNTASAITMLLLITTHKSFPRPATQMNPLLT